MLDLRCVRKKKVSRKRWKRKKEVKKKILEGITSLGNHVHIYPFSFFSFIFSSGNNKLSWRVQIKKKKSPRKKREDQLVFSAARKNEITHDGGDWQGCHLGAGSGTHLIRRTVDSVLSKGEHLAIKKIMANLELLELVPSAQFLLAVLQLDGHLLVPDRHPLLGLLLTLVEDQPTVGGKGTDQRGAVPPPSHLVKVVVPEGCLVLVEAHQGQEGGDGGRCPGASGSHFCCGAAAY